jgi:hypothetical protein
MSRRPLRAALASVLVLGALLALACSSEEDAEGTTTTEAGERSEESSTTSAAGDTAVDAPPGTDGCEAISQVQDLQAQMDQVMTQSQDWAEVQSSVGELRPEMVELYEMAALAAPEVADELGTVGTFTDEGLAAIEESPDMDQYIATVEELPGMQEAVEATLAVDEWTQENCGFGFAG